MYTCLVAEQVRRNPIDFMGYYIIKAHSIKQVVFYLNRNDFRWAFSGPAIVEDPVKVGNTEFDVVSHCMCESYNDHSSNMAPMLMGIHTPIYADALFAPKRQKEAEAMEDIQTLLEVLSGGVWDPKKVLTLNLTD